MGEERGKEGAVGMRRVGMIGLPVILLSSDYRYRFRVKAGVESGEWSRC